MRCWSATCSAALAALLAVPLHAQEVRAELPGWVQEKAVIPPKPVSPLPHWYEVRGGQWQLPPDTLRRLATLLEAKLADNPRFNGRDGRTGYAIQFRAEIDNGRRIVRLEGNCDVAAASRARLSLEFQGIRGGGRCVFHAEYDTVDKRLTRFDQFQI